MERSHRGFRKILIIFTSAALLLSAVPSHAQNASDLAFYVRCYTQFTGNRPALSNPVRRAVAAGTTKGLDACVALLNKVHFNTSGASEGMMTATTDAEAVAVLNHLNDFHRTWFASDNLEGAVTDTNSTLNRDRDIHDETEPALHITRALFQDNVPYSEVVNGSSSMQALRTSGTTFEKTWDGTSGYSNTQSSGLFQKLVSLPFPVSSSVISGSNTDNITAAQTNSNYNVMNAELIQTGDLQGVRKATLNAGKMALQTYSSVGAPISSSLPYPYIYFNQPISVHQSLGAGYLGTKAYLILNLGRPGNTFSDGGLDMPRRWAKAILTETLCRPMPAIRPSDASIYVQQGSILPFRNGQSCMQCHSSMDPLAGIARNVSLRPGPNFGSPEETYSATQVAIHPIQSAHLVSAVDIDADFYKRPPDGKLIYRSFSGEKVYVSILAQSTPQDGFAQLGAALADTDDLYVCAASRYYQMMTGVSVSLQDIGDTTQPTLSDSDLKFRNEVIQLGLSFKQHKSLRTLITNILQSPTYQKISPQN